MLMKSTWRENETMFFTSLEITMIGILHCRRPSVVAFRLLPTQCLETTCGGICA
jgi:hypothetical protein